ncbi:MAG TPA: carbohydrate porin, partial [Verrucomicrobiae bacterium]
MTRCTLATPPTISVPSETETNGAASSQGFFSGLRRSQYLLGDMWGLRPFLSKYGMSLTIL